MRSVLTWEKLPLSVCIKHDCDTSNLILHFKLEHFLVLGGTMKPPPPAPTLCKVLLPLVSDAGWLMRRADGTFVRREVTQPLQAEGKNVAFADWLGPTVSDCRRYGCGGRTPCYNCDSAAVLGGTASDCLSCPPSPTFVAVTAPNEEAFGSTLNPPHLPHPSSPPLLPSPSPRAAVLCRWAIIN